MAAGLILLSALGAAGLALRRELVAVLSGLIEWEGRKGGRIVIGDPRALGVLTGGAVVAFGAWALLGGLTGVPIGGRAMPPIGGGGVAGAVHTPTLTALPLSDTTVVLVGSAFNGSGDQASTDWWIEKDTGAQNDTVWEKDDNADMLTRWIGAGLTAGVSGWAAGDTLVAHVRYNGASASSEVAVDTFRAFEVDWGCDWRQAPADPSPRYRGRIQTTENPGRCFSGYTAKPNSADSLHMLDVLSARTLDTLPASGRFPAEMDSAFKIFVRDSLVVAAPSFMVDVDSATTGLIPDVDEYLFLRTYDVLLMPPDSNFNTHAFHWGTGTNYVGFWSVESTGPVGADSAISIDFTIRSEGTTGPGTGKFSDSSGVTKSYRAHRREVRVHRITTDSAQYQLRIYDASNNLIATGGDYTCTSGTCDITDTLGQFPTAIDVSWDAFKAIQIGDNGVDAGDPSCNQECTWWWGGIALRRSANADDWIGPYPVGGEDEETIYESFPVGYDLSGWVEAETGGTVTAGTTPTVAALGDVGVAVNITSAANAFAFQSAQLQLNAATQSIRFAVTAESLADGNSQALIVFNNSANTGTAAALLLEQNAGQLQAQVDVYHTGVANTIATQNLVVGTAYEFSLTWSNVADTWSVSWDGTELDSGTLTGAAATRDLGTIVLGAAPAVANATIEYAQLAITPE